MIYLNSRYANGYLASGIDPRDGTNHKFVFRRFPAANTRKAYTVYTWMEGDRLDIVANKYFPDSTQYWKILDANPDILDPMLLTPGQQIRIPVNG
jgi:hypothetical protein